MEAMKEIMQSRAQHTNPFREMLQKMGAFGGPQLQDAIPSLPQAERQQGGQQGGGQDLQRLVQMLMAKGMPKEQAMQQAQQLMKQGQGGGANV